MWLTNYNKLVAVVFLIYFCKLVKSWNKPAYNRIWSPPAPSRALDFQSRLASASALTIDDWSKTLANTSVPYIYSIGISNADVQLHYVPDANGNTIPDFSHAGFEGGGVHLPLDGHGAPVFYLSPSNNGTDAKNLLDLMYKIFLMRSNAYGWHGIIQLDAAVYDLRGIPSGLDFSNRFGFIIRGAGSDPDGTILLCGDNCFFLNGRRVSALSNRTEITQPVPTGSYRIHLNSTGFQVNNHVQISLLVTDQWATDMQYNGTTKGYTVLRYVTAIGDDYIEVEAPMYYPIYEGYVEIVTPTFVHHIGFANFRAIRPGGDPNLGLFIDAHGLVEDVFVKNIVTEYIGSLMQGGGINSRRFTFEDCVALFNPIVTGFEPDSRQTFRIYLISQILIHRVSAQYSRDFLTSNRVLTASCVVISHCTDLRSWRPMYYAFGAMYPGQLIEATYSEMGSDWSYRPDWQAYYAVSSVMWNNYVAYEDGRPGLWKCAGPTAVGQNICVGNSKDNSSFWNDVRNQKPVLPTSLYMQQLKERRGCDAVNNVFLPSQIEGKFQYPTAYSNRTWLISNMNKFQTNFTDWVTGNATEFYRGDPYSQTAICQLNTTIPNDNNTITSTSMTNIETSLIAEETDLGDNKHSADSSNNGDPGTVLSPGATAGVAVGSVSGLSVMVAAVFGFIYRKQVRARFSSPKAPSRIMLVSANNASTNTLGDGNPTTQA